jgi:HK97 family phage prohead protease
MGKETMEYKACQSEIKDIDQSGTIVFYPAVFGNEDLGGDTLMPGSTQKTIRENFKNIRHFKHHNSEMMPGVLKEITEDVYGVLAKSQLILGTQIGRETYEEYKAMAEAGKSMDHSIGYRTIKSDNDDSNPEVYRRKLREIKLYEVSTLTAWGMNPLAQTVTVKSLENIDINELLKEQKYFQLLLNCKFTDAKLEDIEKFKNHIDSLILSRKSTQVIEPKVINGSDLLKNVTFKL